MKILFTRIPETTYKKLKRRARKEGLTISELLRKIVIKRLKEEGLL
ncbi:hypothetical protein DRH14_04885 [Candidatus Shapirobacteria bacterium]|nr:MAG: hypothetical protein DRH14_04885 [Candidatus Shapirobacteria bacterium]